MHTYRFLVLLFALAVVSVHAEPSAGGYQLLRVLEVDGRQGVATDGEFYYVSSSTALYRYDKKGELLSSNTGAVEGLPIPANHIGDISVHDGEIYAGVELFEDGRSSNIQIVIYDAESLEYKRAIPWEPESGQVEVSAITVDAKRDAIWMTDWVNGAGNHGDLQRFGQFP